MTNHTIAWLLLWALSIALSCAIIDTGNQPKPRWTTAYGIRIAVGLLTLPLYVLLLVRIAL